jgi:hypothetical protein
MQIEKNRREEIARLHEEIVGHLRQSLEKAIRIGELLTEQKESLKHGEYTPWLKANVPFSDRTAQNYMRVYRERDRIKTETVSDLTGAYKLLADHHDNPDCFDADGWLEIINEVNSTFLNHLKNCQIPTEPGKVFDHLDDGSMTEEERLGFSLWTNFHCHLCYWTNFARVKGEKCLPPRLRRYLKVMNGDEPDWLRKIMGKTAFKICGEHCGHGF